MGALQRTRKLLKTALVPSHGRHVYLQYPQRSAKSWAEYYRRNEESRFTVCISEADILTTLHAVAITRLARKMKRQGHNLSEQSLIQRRAQSSWAPKDAMNSYQVKRKHDVHPDAHGEFDDERLPSRNKRGRGYEA